MLPVVSSQLTLLATILASVLLNKGMICISLMLIASAIWKVFLSRTGRNQNNYLHIKNPTNGQQFRKNSGIINPRERNWFFLFLTGERQMTTFENIVMELHNKLSNGGDYHQELMILKIILPQEIAESRVRRKLQRKLSFEASKKQITK
jgi:hypothetical protein